MGNALKNQTAFIDSILEAWAAAQIIQSHLGKCCGVPIENVSKEHINCVRRACALLNEVKTHLGIEEEQ